MWNFEDFDMSESDPYFVPTKYSQNNKNPHEVIIFNDKKKLKKKEISQETDPIIEEVDMKKARFEIYKFAQTGMSNQDKQKSNIQLALRLGAVPVKNKKINYKLLKEEKLKEKLDKQNKDDLSLRGRQLRPERFSRKPFDTKAEIKKKRKIGSGILKVYGSVKRKK